MNYLLLKKGEISSHVNLPLKLTEVDYTRSSLKPKMLTDQTPDSSPKSNNLLVTQQDIGTQHFLQYQNMSTIVESTAPKNNYFVSLLS